MSKALDVLIPLLLFPLLGAVGGWLVSLATGYTDLAMALGAIAGLAALIIAGGLLPDEPT